MTDTAKSYGSANTGSGQKPAPVDLVLIGRNEGDRLIRALDAVADHIGQIVYVDSGSTDNSVAEATARGAKVVNLDMSIPFTAARARNEGFAALDAPQFVQFIDGDCAIVSGWLDQAVAHLQANPKLGIVTGWRAEIYPDATVYNMQAHLEWRQPAGPITACGGDMMVRAQAFDAVGGFNPSVIAAEDDDFCLRVGKAGWQLERLPQEMTRHDANITTFKQWWQRATRAGHGFAQVDRLHPGHFRTPLIRVGIWAVALPLFALLMLPWTLLIVIALFVASFWRARGRYLSDGIEPVKAAQLSGLLTLSKFPNLIGVVRYYWRVLTGRHMELIEYK